MATAGEPDAKPIRDVSKTTKVVPPKLQPWIEARRRHHLSHAHVQMARELGLNPKKLGAIDNHDQESWKLAPPQFIEHIYLKRFGRARPKLVVSNEQRAREIENEKIECTTTKAVRRTGGDAH
jgi:hypothetical protein